MASGALAGGWETMFYSLEVEQPDDGPMTFEILEQTESSGDDVVLWTEDVEEVEYWITEQIAEKGE